MHVRLSLWVWSANSASSSAPILFSAFFDMDVILRILPPISLSISLWLTVNMYVFTTCSHSKRGPMAAAVERRISDELLLNDSALCDGCRMVGRSLDSPME